MREHWLCKQTHFYLTLSKSCQCKEVSIHLLPGWDDPLSAGSSQYYKDKWTSKSPEADKLGQDREKPVQHLATVFGQVWQSGIWKCPKGRPSPPHTINFPRRLLLCKGDVGQVGKQRDLRNLTEIRPVHFCIAQLFSNEKAFVYDVII